MISLFDDDGSRLDITWQGISLNDPTLNRVTGESTGRRVDWVSFASDIAYSSDPIDDILHNGGDLELYNPHITSRLLHLRGSIRADKESELTDQIVEMQRVFHPLYLQSVLGLDHSGTLVWPPPEGLPDWVRAQPLKFTRVMPKSTDPTSHPDGLFELQYHVVPVTLPDPVRAAVRTGVGVDFETNFLLMDGGRSYDQTEQTQTGDGTISFDWGQAPVWPRILFSMDDAGSATLTITTTLGHMGAALVLDASGLSTGDDVEIDCRNGSIYVNDALDDSIYVSGDYPILRGNGDTTVAWTNTTNVTASSNQVKYRESDYI